MINLSSFSDYNRSLGRKLIISVRRLCFIQVISRLVETLEIYQAVLSCGKIDLTDVLIELKIFFSNTTPTEQQLAVGDMNSSKDINLTDVLLLLKEFFKA